MQDYRLYRIDKNRRVTGPPEICAGCTDEEAIQQARALKHHYHVEVWQGARQIAIVEPWTGDDGNDL